MTQGGNCSAAMYSMYFYTEIERHAQELERLKEKKRQAEKKLHFQKAFNDNFRCFGNEQSSLILCSLLTVCTLIKIYYGI